MSLSVAPIANHGGTFGTFARFFLGVSADDDRTFGVGAPSEVGVLLYFDISEKLSILIVGG